MESAIAGAGLGRYRRIVQMFWDPEPVNDVVADQPAWCLGRSYRLSDKSVAGPAKGHDENENKDHDGNDTAHSSPRMGSHLLSPQAPKALISDLSAIASDTPPASSSASLLSSLAYEESTCDGSGGWPQGFLEDFGSRFWMTYRSEFAPIQRSTDPKATSSLSFSVRIMSQLSEHDGFSSDSGWGCMIRSGQGLLANTLSIIRLGRDWRRGEYLHEERLIVSLFADDPRAPYSIHRFVDHGAIACGKYPGEWFGPSATARCIQALVNTNDTSLRVYSTGDGPDVYENSFMKIAKPDGGGFHPTLILVGTRLGIDKITPVYWEALIASLQMPQSVGIAGGRPSSSHYFVGAQGQYLFYLDPHHTRPALPYHADTNQYTGDEIESCHTTRLRRIHIREVDPSMLIGFLIRSEEDWSDWRRCVKHVQGKAIIQVADCDPVTQAPLGQRRAAIDEVEPFSDEEDDGTISTV
ncbi:Cysteine protease atg4 [Purpureocillium takamizusanense]|uniref:Cysteine protease n=1 Tax=Purpureocillium takamizusanense TaxID=2060973 RepID=A0A9Q8QDL7_9HYPO|nr:Cysteine protease atg4 [Purpureocillium takamizusanense]UNI17322.1 Cysteine protease atg4 [Purpureocillium takamizusanense]